VCFSMGQLEPVGQALHVRLASVTVLAVVLLPSCI
jgi:hypothetical protein